MKTLLYLLLTVVTFASVVVAQNQNAVDGQERTPRFEIGDLRTSLPNPSGHMFQGQFGAKVGKRFSKWGVFGKARPGFVGFTKVSDLVSTQTSNVQILNETITVTLGQFRVAKKFYPSIDIGGVVEFYISRRWMARFDIGDTVIRYGELSAQGFSLRNQIVRRPAETHHNLQITSGIGFRF